VRGIWLYLYLVIDVWSRKVVAWDVDDREDPAIAADLISRACLRERISKGRAKPLILHADNGNAMRAATLESRLEELGVNADGRRELLGLKVGDSESEGFWSQEATA
jgi:transposase InsO family protein